MFDPEQLNLYESQVSHFVIRVILLSTVEAGCKG